MSFYDELEPMKDDEIKTKLMEGAWNDERRQKAREELEYRNRDKQLLISKNSLNSTNNLVKATWGLVIATLILVMATILPLILKQFYQVQQ